MSRIENRLSGSPKARFSRMVAGRLYPRFARSHLPPDEEDLSNDFTAEVERTIRTRLSFAEEAQGYRDHAKLLDDYAQSIQVIREATQQVREMAEAAFRLNTDFQSEKRVSVKARDQFLAEHFEALSREINISLAPPSGILGAELEALPVEMAEIQLRGALDKAVHGFAMQVCDLLDRMGDLELAGLVDWKTHTACNGFFYQDIIIQEELGQQVIKGAKETVAVHDRGRYRVYKVNQEVIKITKGQHTLRHALHETYLSDAESHLTDQFTGIVPGDIRQFLGQLPDWLREMVRIVDGNRRSYRIIAQDVRTEEYEDTEVKILREEEKVVYCPLVTLGHYVLTGWGDEENAVEVARQRSLSLLPLAVVLQLLAIGLFILGQQRHPGFGTAAAVTAALGLTLFLESRRQRRIAASVPGNLLRTVSAAFVWTLFAVGLMALPAGAMSGNTALVIVGVVCVATATVFLCARPLLALRK